MGHVAVDIPGRIRFFAGYGPADVLGICPHRLCEHRHRRVIAWGPDLRRYELIQCDDPNGCDGECRGWRDATDRLKANVRRWQHVGEQTPLPPEDRTIDLRAGV